MLRSPTRWGSPAGCRSRCPRCRPAPDDPGADHLGRRAVPGPAPLAIGAAILRSRLLSWTRSAAARSPTGCSRCCWPAAMPASPLDSADSWDASPARWWPPPPWLWWRSSSRPAGDSRAGRPALESPPLRHRPDHRHLQHPPPRPGRPDHPDRRAAGRGQPDRAANPDVALAATARSGRRNRRDGGSPLPQQEVNGIQLRPAPGRSLPHATPKE